jgi:hypothetical protein
VFDINVDHLSSLVSGSEDKIENLNCTYLEIKTLLDGMIVKNDIILKSFYLNSQSLASKPIQRMCAISRDKSQSPESNNKVNESIVNFSNKENNFKNNKKLKLAVSRVYI